VARLTIYCIVALRQNQGGAGAIVPLKLTKVTLFTIILYNSENGISDIRSIVLSQQCCEVYFISRIVVNPQRDQTTQILLKSAPPNLTGWTCP